MSRRSAQCSWVRHRRSRRATQSATGRVLSVIVGDELLGRVIDPLGNPLDGKGAINATETRLLETTAPSVVERQPVREPLQTGIKAIDAMIPIGRGQRELIIGDRQTGKTALAVDTIINQKQFWGTDQAVRCIYVAIGQKASTVAEVVDSLEKAGALEYTVVVSATASAPARCRCTPLCRLSHRAALDVQRPARPDHLRRPVQQAVAYRRSHCCSAARQVERHTRATCSISQPAPGALRQAVGRERGRFAHRAAHRGDQGNDISAYIPTNVISITDGQIFLETDLFYLGVRPAINAGTSVSRVGVRRRSGRCAGCRHTSRSTSPSSASSRHSPSSV